MGIGAAWMVVHNASRSGGDSGGGDDGGGCLPFLIVFILICVIMPWAIITLMMWLEPYSGDPTLVQVLAYQWHFIMHALHKIW